MDFWDIFINQESTSNTLLIEALDASFEEFHNNIDNFQLIVYTDFVNLDRIDEDEFITAYALLNNIEKVQDLELSAAAVITLTKFYSFLFNDFQKAGENLFQVLDIKSIYFKESTLLENNFINAINTYCNFADAGEIKDIKNIKLKGKLVCIYKNYIIVYYLKEDE